MLVSGAKKSKKMILNQVSYIYFPMQLHKDKKATIQALIDSNSKVNMITLVYAKQQSFWT